MPLTELAARNTKPAERPRKLFDAGGLFLLLMPNGARWWRLKYRIDGREKLLSLGVYPEVSLKRARAKRDEARKLIAAGTDPSAERRTEKAARGITFVGVAREWMALQAGKLAPITLAKCKWMLETHIFPSLGSQPIAKITAASMLAALRRIEAGGTHETAHRTKQRCGQILRYAVATGRADRDVTTDLRGALAPVVAKNHPSIIEPARIGELLRAIDGYAGQPATETALRLAPLVFVRPGELRMAEWREFDLEAGEWRIAAARMKMQEAHIVPLARQAVALLRKLHAITGDGKYVFPSLRTAARPLSDNTINAALRRLGYAKEEMTGHGFRSMASTLLNEQGFAPDIIELQLAHAERNKVRAAYNKAQRLGERRKMMQKWADYLDTLRAGNKVGAKLFPAVRSAKMS
jgi:integrase